MSNSAERVTPVFSIDGMQEARNETRKAINTIAGRIRPGMSEKEAVEIAKEVLRDQGHSSSWYPTRIRFGKNTVSLEIHESDENIALENNDIFIVNIAPRVEQWEGDGGASFTVGNFDKHKQCVKDAAKLFDEVRSLWQERKWTGSQLYDFAAHRALDMGWNLNRAAGGNRISDFPHTTIYSGSLADYTEIPSSMRWVLEIHLTDPGRQFGALFADILLDDSYCKF